MAKERVNLPADILSEVITYRRTSVSPETERSTRSGIPTKLSRAQTNGRSDGGSGFSEDSTSPPSHQPILGKCSAPLLFRNVVIYSIAVSTIRKLNGLALTPYLANAVQEVVCLPQIFIEAYDPWMGLNVGEKYISEQTAFLTTGDLNVALISALQAFPHLSSLVLDYGVNDEYRTYRVLPAFASILSCSLPKLSHLVLRGIELAPYVPIGSVLSSLTRLHITFFSRPFREANLGIPARVPLLLRALPNLTSLSLTLGDCHDEALTPVNWAPARLFHLQHLKLKNINITEKAIMDLVINSATTLEKLEFYQIWLKDSSWASIYTIFCDLLNALTNFTMVNSQYASRSNGRRCVRPKFSDSDVDCFYALFDIINQRRAEKGMSAMKSDYIIAGGKKKYRNKRHFSR